MPGRASVAVFRIATSHEALVGSLWELLKTTAAALCFGEGFICFDSKPVKADRPFYVLAIEFVREGPFHSFLDCSHIVFSHTGIRKDIGSDAFH